MAPLSTLIFAALCGLSVALPADVEARNNNAIRVKYPQKIQDAIDNAPAGSKIIVEKGVYEEQLVITKSGITLEGHEATIVPPTPAIDNACTPVTSNYTAGGEIRQAGICVMGGGVEFDFDTPYNGEHIHVKNVATYIKDVTITGFNVSGFSGLGIALVGSQNTRVAKNILYNDNQYGVLTLASKDNVVTRNKVTSEIITFIGICNDDKSNVKVTVNDISNTIIGLCIQTNGADVSHNTVTSSCAGAFVDPGVIGARVTHNTISNTNPLCVVFGLAFFIGGITIDGASGTDVQHNKVFGITDGNATDGNFVAGIGVYTDFFKTGALANDNNVVFNTLSGNDQDIALFTNGTGNHIDHNKCTGPFC